MKTQPGLASHSFVREMLDLMVPSIADERNKNPLTPADTYNFEVFDAVGSLIQSFDVLDQSQNFVTNTPSAEYLKMLKINRHDWLEYQISTFLITFVTVGDEALLLVNAIFCLGLDPRHCRSAVLKNNKWVKDTDVPKHLEAIEKVIERHRKTRNLLVHRGKNPSLNTLFKSGSLDQLKMISFAFQHKPQNFSDKTSARLDKAYVKVVLQIGKSLDSDVSQLKTAAWQLLTITHKLYNQYLSALSNSSSARSTGFPN